MWKNCKIFTKFGTILKKLKNFGENFEEILHKFCRNKHFIKNFQESRKRNVMKFQNVLWYSFPAVSGKL